MEEEKKGKKISLSVVLSIIALIVIVVMGVFIFKLNKDKKELEEAFMNASEQIRKINEESADEKYKDYIMGLKNSMKNLNKYGETFYGEQIVPNMVTDYTANEEYSGIKSIELKNNGDLYLILTTESKLSKINGTTNKLASNVIKAGAMSHGQDSSTFVYYITDDGKFYYWDYTDPTGTVISQYDLSFQEAESLKNIVSVQTFDSIHLLAIDIEGNTYRLSDICK